ncbi:hypothetical protein SUGI_0624400 [Cryptomeria japonica]|nr:hypothetical protein SUGI_0624400 [Cryptomeria japonica]
MSRSCWRTLVSSLAPTDSMYKLPYIDLSHRRSNILETERVLFPETSLKAPVLLLLPLQSPDLSCEKIWIPY